MAEIFPDNIDDFGNVTDGERKVFELLKSDVKSSVRVCYLTQLRSKLRI